MNRWASKVAVVTGASAGIGAAISRALTKESVKVVGLARRGQRLEELTDQLGKDKFFPIVCDLRKEEDIVKAFKWIDEKLDGADILINNAGVADVSKIIDTTADEYHRILDTNIVAPGVCAREAIKLMKKRGIDGHIVNISSIAGHNAEMVSIPVGMYCASKYALTALAIELRHEIELADLKIKVTNISPGPVMTDMLIKGLDLRDLNDARTLRVADVVNAITYALGTSPLAEVYDVIIMPMLGRKMLRAPKLS
ncbi:farnesol dehydrogenase-like [Megalopta genalis]|uniref:farnesol dehydrogenase-like n=1 Tax=Megalopta genalis TaxID=115081 RepID=UPI003FD132E3